MKLAMIGLGKMGANMATRLLKDGHEIVAFDLNKNAVKKLEEIGAEPAFRLEELKEKLSPPRVMWVMVPSGAPTEATITQLIQMMEKGDIIIDGGNSNYRDSKRRAEMVQKSGLHFVDVGTSGGVWGLKEGYSMMIGGETEIVENLRPIFETLAPGKDTGWGHVGPSGAGHFVKMVHNGIEYGLMQAYAEGFEILKKREEFSLDLHQIAEIWRFGSVIRSWLLDLTAEALKEDQNLSDIKGWVADSGEGRWTVADAIELDVPAPVITLSLMMRFVSRQDESFAAKILAAMRNQFGGHAVKKSEN
ncbi:MAG: decarboxylating 6-phosphogluconate dehydrogenase [Calditrichaeota bacterium]|nr:decarboxylating 6-phosphogluconate dehydrogenase [Calditrichota bacterium]